MEVVQCGIAAVFYGITQVDFYIDDVDVASFNMHRLAVLFLAKSTLLLHSPFNNFRVCVFYALELMPLNSLLINSMLYRPTHEEANSSDVCAEV